MSNSFSLTRLGKLIKKQFFENLKFYTYCVLALTGLLALVFAFWIQTDGPRYGEQATYMVFLIGLFISGSVFASMSFNALGEKDKGIYWLSLPATHLEKLLASLFFTTFLFTVVYCLCFFIIKSIAILLLKQIMADVPGFSYVELQDLSKGFMEVFPYFICGFYAVQALYLLGSVYFPRYSFIMTSVVVAMLFFSFMYYMYRLENSFFDNGFSWNITTANKRIEANPGTYWSYSVSPSIKDTFKYLFMFAWVPIFWFATWFRLREKEI